MHAVGGGIYIYTAPTKWRIHLPFPGSSIFSGCPGFRVPASWFPRIKICTQNTDRNRSRAWGHVRAGGSKERLKGGNHLIGQGIGADMSSPIPICMYPNMDIFLLGISIYLPTYLLSYFGDLLSIISATAPRPPPRTNRHIRRERYCDRHYSFTPERRMESSGGGYGVGCG